MNESFWSLILPSYAVQKNLKVSHSITRVSQRNLPYSRKRTERKKKLNNIINEGVSQKDFHRFFFYQNGEFSKKKKKYYLKKEKNIFF
jgi:hypothetical protein